MNKNEFKNLYLNDNNSGKYSRESYMLKNIPDIYDQIIEYSKKFDFDNLSFKEKNYLFVNDIDTNDLE